VKVFISHSSANQDEYDRLRRALRGYGFEVWGDESMIGGNSVCDQLRQAIAECGSCVYLATSESAASMWCHAEVGAFWGAGKKVIVFAGDSSSLDETQLPPQVRDQFRVPTYERVVESLRHCPPIATATFLKPSRIPGRRLFQHRGFYPVNLEPATNRPVANRRVFARAVDHLLERSNFDLLAAMDLVYLRVDNLPYDRDLLYKSHQERYSELIAWYQLKPFLEEFAAEKDRVFKDYKRIVQDIGETLQGSHFEILLHDVRNPFRSIVEARNTKHISSRKVGDPSTRFVVNYVKNQGEQILALEAGSKVAYLKRFATGKRVKATTTPVFDDRYGLVGVLCCNIDLDAIESLSPSECELFLKNYCTYRGATPDFEK
jgi:hypothetical protein